MKPDFFPRLQVLHAFFCGAGFFKVKHMTWITKGIAQPFPMAPLARIFFSSENR